MAISPRSNRLHKEALEDRTMLDGDLAPAVFDSPWFEDGGVFETPDSPAKMPMPAFSSKPDAPATLYLDFSCHNETAWENGQPGTTCFKFETPAFELLQETPQEDFSSFDSIEVRVIKEIWQAVAENFAQFNVNVTTVNPGNFSDRKAMRVAVGGLYQDSYRSMLQYR